VREGEREINRDRKRERERDLSVAEVEGAAESADREGEAPLPFALLGRAPPLLRAKAHLQRTRPNGKLPAVHVKNTAPLASGS